MRRCASPTSETIYRSLYVQGRGGLRRELTKCLRTRRSLRKPRRTTKHRGRIAGMVNIAERPVEADDRAVPGHWEGDLITGAENKSAIGTLVERATGYVALLHLPDDHGADTVQHAMIAAMRELPATLRRTLAWDQGIEMANHVQIADATDLSIYFCDQHSPWQRGTNETPTDSYASTSRRAPTCPATPATTSTSSPRNSTADRESASAGVPLPRRLTN